MNLEKKLKDYGESMKIIPDELKVTETIRKSVEAYCLAEQERFLTYWEFLWTQLRLVRKRWWLFQLLLLILLWAVLPSIKIEQLVQRIFGVAASLFIILIIPELFITPDLCGENAAVWHCGYYFAYHLLYVCRCQNGSYVFTAFDTVPVSYDGNGSLLFWDFMQQISVQ